jgi:hypothetical protein
MPNEFWYGLLGGVFAEVFGLWKLRREATPEYCRNWFYWLTTLAMILCGGGLAFIYVKSGVALAPIVAVNIGASAPLIIGSLTAAPPKISG